MARRPILLVCLALLPALAGPAGAQTVTVPLKVFPSGHIAISAMVDGKGPFRFVLDTGSPPTILSQAAARRLHLGGRSAQAGGGMSSLFGGMGGMGGMGSMGSMGMTATVGVRVGAARVPKLPVIVMDHPVVQMLSTIEGRVDGILGFSFFSHFRTTIDYAAGKLTLTPVPYQPADILQNVMKLLMSDSSAARVVGAGGLWGLTVGPPAAGAAGEGMVVREVFSGGAADAAGIRPGDVIATVDDRWTMSLLDLLDAASRVKPGQAATVRLLRGGAPVTVMVRPRPGL